MKSSRMGGPYIAAATGWSCVQSCDHSLEAVE